MSHKELFKNRMKETWRVFNGLEQSIEKEKMLGKIDSDNLCRLLKELEYLIERLEE